VRKKKRGSWGIRTWVSEDESGFRRIKERDRKLDRALEHARSDTSFSTLARYLKAVSA